MLPYDDDVKTDSFGDITVTIIILCVLVFGGEYYISTNGTDALRHTLNYWGLVPDRLLHHFDMMQPVTLLTSCFLHAGIYHLVGNMWYLYLFGRSVEDRMGRNNYLLFYLICGLSAAIAYAIFNPTSEITCVGASGAISGVMGAYVVFNPDAKVKVWMGWLWGTLEVSALLVMAAFYIMNLAMSFFAATLGTVTHVGYAAHIAGFISGLVLAKFMETRQAVIATPAPSWERVR